MNNIYKKISFILIVCILYTFNINATETMLTLEKMETNIAHDEICEIDHDNYIEHFDNVNITTRGYVKNTNNLNQSFDNINTDDYIINESVNGEKIILSALDSNKNTSLVQLTRGEYMWFYPIPYILHKGETVEIKQVSGLNQEHIYVDIVARTSANSNYRLGIGKDGEVATYTAIEDSILYLKAPRTTFDDITVEYSLSSATTLPIYYQNQSKENIFFEEWDYLNTEMALLIGENIIFQIPIINKEELRNINGISPFDNKNHFDDIDHLFSYYDNMFDFYDALYGLDNSTDYNYRSQSKFIFYSDESSKPYLAYYMPDRMVVAHGSIGIRSALTDNWLGKHEVAHGYELKIRQGIKTIEKWTNIAPHFYSKVSNGNNNEYLEDYIEKRPNLQKKLYDFAINNSKIAKGETEGEVGVIQEVFIEPMELFGTDWFTTSMQELRFLATIDEFNKYNKENQLAKLFSLNSNIDFVPFYESLGYDILQEIRDNTVHLPKAYYLTDLITSEETKNYIISNFDLYSEYSLFDTSLFYKDERLKDYRGTLEIEINIDNIENLNGKQLKVSNGDLEFYVPIKSNTLKLENIPVGVYSISPPLTNEKAYDVVQQQSYAVVKEDSILNFEINYNEPSSYILFNSNQIMKVLNQNGKMAFRAILSPIDNGRNEFKLDLAVAWGVYMSVTGDKDVKTFEVKVFDENDNEVYQIHQTNHIWNQAPLTTNSQRVLTVKDGYKVKVYAHNNDMIVLENTITGHEYVDKTTNVTTYNITKNGLIPNDETFDMEAYVLENMYIISEKILKKYNTQYEGNVLRNGFRHLLQFISEENKDYVRDYYKAQLKYNNPVLKPIKDEVFLYINDGRIIDFKKFVEAYDVEDGDLFEKIEVDLSNFKDNSYKRQKIPYYVEDSDRNFANVVVNITILEEESNDNESTDIDNDEGDDDDFDNWGTEEDDDSEFNYDNWKNDDDDDDFEYDLDLWDNDNVNNNNNNVIDNYNYKFDTRSFYSNVIVDEFPVQVGDDIRSKIVPFYNTNYGTKHIEKLSYTYDDKIVVVRKTSNSSQLLVNDIYFNDIQNSWAKESINFTTSREILVGVGNNNFAPNENLTRAMIVTALSRITDENVDGYISYFDDTHFDWYTKYIGWGEYHNIINGINYSNTFNPNKNLTREEMAIILVNYFRFLDIRINTSKSWTFSDENKISPEALYSVYALNDLGIFVGNEYNEFSPKDNLTRAEFATIMERVIKLILDNKVS